MAALCRGSAVFGDGTLRVLVAVYLTAFVSLAFVLPIVRTWRRTGIMPLRAEDTNTAHGYIARVFGVLTAVGAVVAAAYVFWPELYVRLGPIAELEQDTLRIAGCMVLLAALPWVVIAQRQMGDSWRIGVDSENRTELVAKGLFRLSRNPIFLGLIAALAGLFLVLPSAATLLLLVMGYYLVQIEVRLEEAHLRGLHGEVYEAYCRGVRRWI